MSYWWQTELIDSSLGDTAAVLGFPVAEVAPDGRVLAANPAWLAMTQSTLEVPLCEMCCLGTDDAALVEAALTEVSADHRPRAFELDVPALGLDRWARMYFSCRQPERVAVAVVPLRRLIAHEAGFDPDAFVSAYEYLSPAILLLDVELNIRIATGFVSNFLGQSGTVYEGRSALDEIHPADRDAAVEKMAHILDRAGDSAVADIRVLDSGGTYRWVEATAINLLDHPNVGGLLVMLRNVEQRKLLEAELAHRASHDGLTGLPNRVALLDRLTQVLAEQAWSARYVAVMFLDLDNLKDVNDSVGHEVGDDLLIEVAHRLQTAVRPSDFVSRLGGDEFVAVCAELASEAQALNAAERIRQAISGRHTIGHHEVFLSASIGVTVIEPHRPLTTSPSDDALTMLRDADTAMYDAKTSGRARVSRFTAEMHSRASDRMRLAAGLDRAVGAGEFENVYQPILDLGTGQVMAVEALLRWNHPERGTLRPSQFLTLAEETGQIVTIGDWVLDRSLQDVAWWRDTGHPEMTVHVNISARQATDPALTERILRALHRHSLPTSALVIELGEVALTSQLDDPNDTLRRLRDAGIGLAFDDFGTGSSSLSLLRRFPVTQLKLDGTFVSELASDPAGVAVTRSIVELAHALGMVVVAESLVNADDLAALRRLGCDRAQGYLLGDPAEAALVGARLDADMS